MAITALAVTDIPSNYAGTAATLAAFEAADIVNGNSIPGTGDCLLLAIGGTGGDVVTVTSTPDPYGRSASIVESIAAGAYAIFPVLPVEGYVQSDGTIHVSAVKVTTLFAVLRQVTS